MGILDGQAFVPEVQGKRKVRFGDCPGCSDAADNELWVLAVDGQRQSDDYELDEPSALHRGGDEGPLLAATWRRRSRLTCMARSWS